jgi:hypothetical protein
MQRLIKAGVHLFSLEALLWYASQKEIRDLELVRALVADFGSRVREDFHPTPLLSLRTSSWNDDTTVHRLAKDILAGKADWLEDGIIKIPPVDDVSPAPSTTREYVVT